MKRKINFLFLFLAALLVFSMFLSSHSASKALPQDIKLVILHTNDMHGHLDPFQDKGMKIAGESLVGGMANLASVIIEERKKNPESTILLDAGDMFQGTASSNFFYGVPVVEIMNYLGYDAAALGNHEFDWGIDVIGKTLKLARFDILCANATSEKNYLLFKTIKPYKIFKRQGVKIAVIGLITTSTPAVTMPSNVKDVKFSDPVGVFNKYYKEVKSKGADLVIILSHMGTQEDMDLAGKIKGADIIVEGHSHMTFEKPKVVNGIVLVQAGSYGRYLGILEITLDAKTKKIKKFTASDELFPIIADNIKPDKNVAKLVANYNKKIAPVMEKVVCIFENDLPRPSIEADFPLGNLICDALKDETGSQIAFQNSGGIRSALYKGEVKMKDIYTVLPFDNNAVTMDLTGKQILDIMEKALMPGGHRMQVSGITVKYDSKRPAGEKIVELKIAGEKVDFNKFYKIVTNSFLAEGGDNFTVFKTGKNIQYGELLRDIFKKYLEKHSPLNYEVTGRLIDVSKEKEKVNSE